MTRCHLPLLWYTAADAAALVGRSSTTFALVHGISDGGPALELHNCVFDSP